jgi:hypothetical protein
LTNLRTNSRPQFGVAKLVVLVNWEEPHETKVLLWPRGRWEDILRGPEDQLGTAASGAPETEIVKMRLEFGDLVARGLYGRNAGGFIVVLPETSAVGGVVG